MNELSIFDYNGSKITFEKNGVIMVNATEMAKPFDKSPWKWLELPSTKEYIKALSENRSLAENQFVASVRGGNDPNARGNWFHEDLALEFARWLSPSFAIWCNDRIKELLTTGHTSVKQVSRKDLALMVIQQEEDIERLSIQNELQSVELKKSAPKVEYHDKVLQSHALITTTVIAKELGMSAEALNEKLKDMKIQYKVAQTWVLHSKYQNMELTGTKTANFTDSLGNVQTRVHTYWTEKGRKFIHTKLQESMCAV